MSLGLAAAAPRVWAADFFDTKPSVPALAAGSLIESGRVCRFGPLGEPLMLREAIERALCNNSKTREAWANIKIQAAAVGVSHAAYLPALSATYDSTHDEASTDVVGHSEFSSRNGSNVQAQSVSLSWVLLDFGGREASVRNANVDLPRFHGRLFA